MRADRLLTMMMLLQKHKRMTAQALAQELNVSKRTIYRDIEALSLAGIPVYAQSGTNGGVFMDGDYRSSLTGLSKNQALSLFTVSDEGPLADMGMERAVKDSLLKLFSTLPFSQQNEVERMRQRFYIDPVGWFNFGDTSDYLATLQEVVWEDKQVHMKYRAYGREPYDVTLDAYALVSKADKWYLVGRKSSGDYRIYRLTHIKNLSVLDSHFERDNTFKLIDYWQQAQHAFQQQMVEDFPAYPVTLSIHSNVFWYISNVLEGRFKQLTPLNDDGWCQIEIHFTTDYEAHSHILAMGLYVKIIEPTNLQNTMQWLTQKMTEHYS